MPREPERPAPSEGVLVDLARSKTGQASATFPVLAGNAAVTLTITSNTSLGKKAIQVTIP